MIPNIDNDDWVVWLGTGPRPSKEELKPSEEDINKGRLVLAVLRAKEADWIKDKECNECGCCWNH